MMAKKRKKEDTDTQLAAWVSQAANILPTITASLKDKEVKIDLATAENWVIRDELALIYQEAMSGNFNASGFGGPPRLLEALAHFFNENFAPVLPVLPHHCVVTTGASLCLDMLLFTLCERGDRVLVAAPYFSQSHYTTDISDKREPCVADHLFGCSDGFDLHLTLRSGCRIIPVHTEHDAGPASGLGRSLVPSLDQAYRTCAEPGRLKALVITNPHNPFGTCYPEHVIREAMLWCRTKGVHYISDEVYALSNFGDSEGNAAEDVQTSAQRPVPFISALAVDLPRAENRGEDGDGAEPADLAPISVIWSTSKDLGSSGLRLGVYVRRSSSAQAPASRCLLTTALALLTTPHLPSLTCDLTTALLTSPRLPALLSLNRTRLRHNYHVLVTALQRWDVSYVPATNAPFLLARLGVLYSRFQLASGCARVKPGRATHTCTAQEEEKMVAFLRERTGVLVSPGRGFHMTPVGMEVESYVSSPMAGWVRVTFGVPEAVLKRALLSISIVLDLPIPEE